MKTILLIEDSKDIRENTAEILELSDYKVITAENGKIGVELAVKEKPDLIICDIMMPVLDGYGVLHLLNKNKDTATIPFIFITAKTERRDLRKGMEMGADDYITKPFEEVELMNAIEIRLRKSESLKKEFETSVKGINEFLRAAGEVPNINLISENTETRIFKKKQTIYEEGVRPRTLFFVSKGKVKIFRQNEDGKELITSIMKEGDFFGYVALLEDLPYDDVAEAMEEAEVILIPKEDFFTLLHGDMKVAAAFIHLMANRLTDKENQLIDLAYNSLRKRVADALLLVYDRYKSPSNPNPSLQITREDLAQVVGTATESLIRTLSDFKSLKLIEIMDGKIMILSEEKLRKLLN